MSIDNRFLSVFLSLACVTLLHGADADRIDFSREVRPILAKHCFTCHGPDEDAREADLRLDQQAGSRADMGGYQAIDPGNPNDSELIARIVSDDDDIRMPPAESHEPLSAADIKILRQWISEGGEYTEHWSLVPATRPAIPQVSDPQWCRGPIDRFILKRMEQEGLSPAPPANKTALIRRVYLDLLGTLPTPQQTADFLDDSSPIAYEQLVDRLLASPEYGERFARPWLDLARYSDTNGYEKDRNRTIWPYRDWVINAINADQPFDQFSIEQLAGDMLPGASQSQRIATGFHRNTMLNEEGGIDPLEYRFYAMVDRVATTGTVWMGLTTGCAQCHTHKYDPITHTDYYALMALMNNADEPELSVDPPSVAAERESILKQIKIEERKLADSLIHRSAEDSILKAYDEWINEKRSSAIQWKTVSPTDYESTMPRLVVQDDGAILASGDSTKRDVYTLKMADPELSDPITAIRIEAMPHASLPATGPGLAFYEGRRGDFFLSELDVSVGGKDISLAVGSTTVPGSKPGNGKVYPGNVFDGDGSTGWSIPGESGQTHRLVVPFEKPLVINGPWTIEMLFERHYVAGLGHFRIDVSTAAQPTANNLPSDLQQKVAGNKASASELAIQFARLSPTLAKQRKPIDALRKRLPSPVRTLVMRERPADNPRATQRHHRGEYLQPKESVSPSVPAVFVSAVEARQAPRNRLDLAQWLVSDGNPLVARVTANRAWRQFFGTGIVRTAGDFGTQSEPPSHPQLIDWLDQRLRDQSPGGGLWSIKRLHREIVLSSTYRQSTGKAPNSDPDNRLLSVFPYRRIDAERIRDSFLSASGLLSRSVGGPSVHPPQPLSVVQMAYGKPSWPTSEGADRYRRSLYTFSKRTAPFAAFTTFDGPSGELCIARRDRSTTPLQALTLLNDQMYLEIAEGLANATLRDVSQDGTPPSPSRIARQMFRRLLVREPTDAEVEDIVRFYSSQSDHDQPWMLVARALLNTDEAITTP